VKNIPEVSSSSNINSFIDSTSLSCVKPKSPDIFVAYSTPFGKFLLNPFNFELISTIHLYCTFEIVGKFSLRDRQEGSWFIQEVVKVFSKHYSSLDIHDLFTTVARNVRFSQTMLYLMNDVILLGTFYFLIFHRLRLTTLLPQEENQYHQIKNKCLAVQVRLRKLTSSLTELPLKL